MKIRILSVFTLAVIAAGYAISGTHVPPLVASHELTIAQKLEVESHIPVMQHQLEAMRPEVRKLLVAKLLVSKDPRMQYALVRMDLSSATQEFHGPTVPPPPCAPDCPGYVYNCPCSWWDLPCIWQYWNFC